MLSSISYSWLGYRSRVSKKPKGIRHADDYVFSYCTYQTVGTCFYRASTPIVRSKCCDSHHILLLLYHYSTRLRWFDRSTMATASNASNALRFVRLFGNIHKQVNAVKKTNILTRERMPAILAATSLAGLWTGFVLMEYLHKRVVSAQNVLFVISLASHKLNYLMLFISGSTGRGEWAFRSSASASLYAHDQTTAWVTTTISHAKNVCQIAGSTGTQSMDGRGRVSEERRINIRKGGKRARVGKTLVVPYKWWIFEFAALSLQLFLVLEILSHVRTASKTSPVRAFVDDDSFLLCLLACPRRSWLAAVVSSQKGTNLNLVCSTDASFGDFREGAVVVKTLR